MTGPERAVGRLRVVVAEDVLLLREGIVRILERTGFEVVGAVGDAERLLVLVDELRPELVLVDIRMPPTETTEGLEAVRSLRARHGPSIGLVVLSQYLDPAFAQEALTGLGGATGYLLKERVADPDVFGDSLRRVARGEIVIDPEIVRRLLGRGQPNPLGDLTDRERAVLGLVAEGRSNQAIGDRLGVTTKTVETHVNSIFSKLGLEPGGDDNRRVLAVLAFLRARPSAGVK